MSGAQANQPPAPGREKPSLLLAQPLLPGSTASSAATVAPSRLLLLKLLDVHTAKPVAGLLLARLKVNGAVLYDREDKTLQVLGEINPAPPLSKVRPKPKKKGEQTYSEVELMEAFEFRKRKDLDVQPTPAERAVLAKRAARERWIGQIKSALFQEQLYSGQIDAQTSPSELSRELTKYLMTGGYLETKLDLLDMKQSEALAAVMKRMLDRSDGAGFLRIWLPYAAPGTTTDLEIELVGHKLTQPAEKLVLPEGKDIRKAMFDPQKAANDYCYARKQPSAWRVETGHETLPLHNWCTFSITWDQDVMERRESLVLTWCQPSWYTRKPEHGTAHVGLISEQDKDFAPHKAPVVDNVPTLMVSTSRSSSRGRHYGQYGRRGRITPVGLNLQMWKRGETCVHQDACWTEIPAPAPGAPPAPAETDPPPYPDAVKQVRTFKATATTTPPDGVSWSETSGAGIPPHARAKLAGYGSKFSELTKKEVKARVYELKEVAGGEATAIPALAKDRSTDIDAEKYNRAVLKVMEVTPATAGAAAYTATKTNYRAMALRRGSLYRDPDWTFPHATYAKAHDEAQYRWHMGIDVTGHKGDPVFAMRAGKSKAFASGGGGGQLTLVTDAGTWTHLHCETTSAVWNGVKNKTLPVKAGDIIGLLGRTGSEHAHPYASHCHMQGTDITILPEDGDYPKGDKIGFSSTHRGLLPRNEMIPELVCAAEYGTPGPGEEGKANNVNPLVVDTNRCFGRNNDPNAPIQAADRIKQTSGPYAGKYLYKENETCWAYMTNVCPYQAAVKQEIKRRNDLVTNPAPAGAN